MGRRIPGRRLLGLKRLTRKKTLITDPTRYIHYLGPTICGSTHYYQLIKNELNIKSGLLDLFDLLTNLCCLGLVADYHLTPYSLPQRSKKRLHATLTDAQ